VSIGDYYDREGQRISEERYMVLSRDDSYRRVAQERVGRWWISTVWLGMDHSYEPGATPVIFESMAFLKGDGEDERDHECHRYSTLPTALEGHARMVERFRVSP